MEAPSSCVPFPLASVGLASTAPKMFDTPHHHHHHLDLYDDDYEPDVDGDLNNNTSPSAAYQLPALTRPRPHHPHAHHIRNQSFYEGIQFATRICTSRRGESRSASRQPSLAPQTRSSPQQQQQQQQQQGAAAAATLADEEEGFLSDEDDLDFWPEDSHHHHMSFDVEDDEGPLDADGSPRVFDEGDRIGAGMLHAHMPVQDCFAHPVDRSARRLEIVRKLGSGSYAVVYLARAVLWDPEVDGVDPTNGGDDNDDDDNDGLEFGGGVVYGQEFALKCLSKHNLSDELLEVQRFEATLHQKVPSHPNIVAMHGAFETDAWLFLVLEYCPGQDLFYWLEQAKDHEDVDDAMHPTASFTAARAQQQRLAQAAAADSYSATPPSPTLLSITAMSSLLSRRRLKLISRMFRQMCDAVQACHDVGISHRDIKPENFLCCEDNTRDGSERRVTVKIMDWGLGTAQEECGDFDCGSKPYMAYECRNNLAPTYFPKGSDVWSLGIVLLNLLFHRCPWGQPTDEDEDFYEFHTNPVAFLLDRFQGIGREVAQYLADNVLNCVGARVSAAQLGEWASNLVYMMSDPRPAQPRKTSVSDAALPLVASHRPADFPRFSHVLAPSASSSSGSSKARPRSSLLAQALSDNPAPSPTTTTTTSGPHTMTSSPLAFEVKDLPAELETHLHLSGADKPPASSLKASPIQLSRPLPTFPLETIPGSLPDQGDHLAEDTPPAAAAAAVVVDAAGADSDAQALAAKAKRRKRGARRGRSAARAEASEARDVESRARSPRASHQQQQQRKPHSSSRHRPPLPASPLSDPSLPKAASPAQANAGGGGGGGFAGRFRGAFKNGNSDLEMFVQRARDREAGLSGNSDTNSAPAKLQQGGHHSQTTSFGTTSAHSTASWKSGDDNDPRTHWSSTAARRERLRGQKAASSETSSHTSVSNGPSRMSSFSSEPTTISEASTPSSPPYRSPERSAKPATPSLSRIDEQMQPLRQRPEPPSTMPTQTASASAAKPPPASSSKPKSGFFKGLFR